MARTPGLSVRLKLTLSYASFLLVAGALLLTTVWVFLLRYVPDQTRTGPGPPGPVSPNRTDLLDAFTPRAVQALTILLVLGLVGGWLLAGRMLAPLTRITDAARHVAAGSLSHRIRLEGPSDEFRELADAFDAMLTRLEAYVAEEQRFAANASHELRTPLAITQALLEVARKDPALDHGELVTRLYDVNARAIGVTEALLLLSRADRRSFTAEPVDLSLLAEDAVETLLPLAEERGVRIQTSGGTTLAAGSPALLQQLTTNLVHNASSTTCLVRAPCGSRPGLTPMRSSSASRTPASRSAPSWWARWRSPSTVAPDGPEPTTPAWASAWPSWTASPPRTTGP